MKITKDKLTKIIKEELISILSEGHGQRYMPGRKGDMGPAIAGPASDPMSGLKDLQMALRALGPDSLTADNLETIQSLLDRLKASVGPRPDDGRIAPSLEERYATSQDDEHADAQELGAKLAKKKKVD